MDPHKHGIYMFCLISMHMYIVPYALDILYAYTHMGFPYTYGTTCCPIYIAYIFGSYASLATGLYSCLQLRIAVWHAVMNLNPRYSFLSLLDHLDHGHIMAQVSEITDLNSAYSEPLYLE